MSNPADLWNLDVLQRAPDHEVLSSDGDIQAILYRNEPYRGKPTRVFAYLGIPAPAARVAAVPGMVCVHGGGGRAFKQWVALWNARGYAAIAMDLGGCGADGQRLPDGGPAQGHEEKFADPVEGWKDHWTYHSIAAVMRAHSILRSLPGVDPARIGVTGISWGGYLTCIVGGIDHRFACAIPVYGCGFLQHNSAWLEIFAGPARTSWP